MGQTIAFYVLAAFILGFAIMVVTTKDTVHSVLFLVVDFLFVAALYVLLGAQFLAAIQVLVYAGGIVVSSVATTLFLGGWLRPFPNVGFLHFLDIIPSWGWFLLKSFVFLYIFIWVRATLPRYRYDQLMRLGWKVLIPLAIVNLLVTGIVKVLLLV